MLSIKGLEKLFAICPQFIQLHVRAACERVIVTCLVCNSKGYLMNTFLPTLVTFVPFVHFDVLSGKACSLGLASETVSCRICLAVKQCRQSIEGTRQCVAIGRSDKCS